MTTTPIAEPAVAASGPVLMTADEARACVDRIKARTEDILEEILNLRNREGYKALGYKTWQECLRAEFQMSRQRAHQLVAAHKVEQILASRNFDATGMKESHLAELAPLADDPDRLTEVASEVRAAKGDRAKAENYRQVAGVKAPRERRSVSSSADPSDSQDLPDDDGALGFAPDVTDESGSQETYAGSPNAERWCPDCGGKYRGDRCSCKVAPAELDTTRTIGYHEPAVAETVEPAPPATQDEREDDHARSTHAVGAGPPDRSETLAGAASGFRPARSTGLSAGVGGKSHGTHTPAYHPVTVDGKAPEPIYPFPEQIVNYIDSHIAGDAFDEFDRLYAEHRRQVMKRRQMAGQTGPDAQAPAVDLREALSDDGCTVVALSTAIGETFTVDARASLLALLADAMPADRLGPLAHRLSVRVKNTGEPPEPSAEPRTLTDVKALIREHLTAADIRSLESELPIIRKDVGGRERALATAGARS